MTRELVVVTRLGLRFAGRPLESEELFERRLSILGLAAQRFVEGFDRCIGWVIETDVAWYERLVEAIQSGRIVGPPGGMVAVSRRNTRYEQADLGVLGLGSTPLLLVRLDSDDTYVPDSVREALNVTQALPEGVMVDFPHGYLAEPRTGQVSRFSYVIQGPFLGFTADGLQLDRIHGPHAAARSRATATLRIPRRSWVQSVHGSNIETTSENAGVVMRLRTLRRELARNPENRRPSEMLKYFSDPLVARRSEVSQAIGLLGAASEWPS